MSLVAYRNLQGQVLHYTIALVSGSPLLVFHKTWQRNLMRDDLREWFRESGVRPEIVYEHNVITIRFDHAEDAMAFKMRWL